MMKKVFLFFASFVFILFCFLIIFFFTIRKDILFEVKEGNNISVISRRLYAENASNLSSALKVYFKFWNIFSPCNKIHTGVYEFKRGELFFTVCHKICKGLSENTSITIPEGLMTFQVVDMINNENKLSGHKISFSTEGVLLPETYTFKSGTNRERILKKMQYDFNLFVEKEWKNRDKKRCFLDNIEDMIILASIVEAEAKNDKERPIIASVYLNRLKKGMLLQADPTTIYEITKGKYKLNRLLTLKDLKLKGDFNTYTKKGLPISPICNPSKASLLAVMHPDETNYLYFIAKEDLSGHIFSKTYNEHLSIKRRQSKKQ